MVEYSHSVSRHRRLVRALVIAACGFTPCAWAASPEKQELKVGFIKLADCAPLVVAYEKGYFEEEGLYVTLEVQANWKIVVDRVIDGGLDASHMLPGQALGAVAGVGSQADLVSVAGMGVNTLAITVGKDVWSAMKPNLTLAEDKPQHPISAGALKPVIEEFSAAGNKFGMGMVFPTSTHNYVLRYWLAAGGIHPGYYTASDSNGTSDGEVALSVTPPPQMPSTLAAGTIAGYSVGEPWNQQAGMRGIGVPVVTAPEVWSRTPEKILGMRRDFAEKNPETVKALVKAIIRAEQWIDADNGANRDELAKILSRSEYVGADYDVLVEPLKGEYQYEQGDLRTIPELNAYFRDFAGYPFAGDAIWFLTQMRRWGQLADQSDSWYAETARRVYRSDLYRAAAAELISEGKLAASDLPAAELTIPPGAKFIDGIEFDPAQPNAYLAKFAIGMQGSAP